MDFIWLLGEVVMAIKDGGPAFPLPSMIYPSGMSLRDYFAAKAIAALADTPRADDEMELVADRAYRLADAMLKAREAK